MHEFTKHELSGRRGMAAFDRQGHELQIGDIVAMPDFKVMRYGRIDAFRTQPYNVVGVLAVRPIANLCDQVPQRFLYYADQLTWCSSAYADTHPTYLVELFKDGDESNA